MIPQEKLRDIATKLLEKSRAAKVNWLADPDFHVDFPSSRVVIRWVASVTDEDSLEFSVQDNRGRPLGVLEAYDGSDQWPLLKDLQMAAEKCVTGWDRVLVEIESNLDTEGIIGEEERQSSGATKLVEDYAKAFPRRAAGSR